MTETVASGREGQLATRTAATLAFLVATLISANAAAQDDERLYLERPAGPIITSNRLIALGGAFTGVGEGADGHLYNPATFASRYGYSTDLNVDWDYSLYWLGADDNVDLQGTSDAPEANVFLGGGLDLKIHGFGFGFHADFASVLIELEPDDPTTAENEEVAALVNNISFVLGAGFGVHALDMLFGVNLDLYSWDFIHTDLGLVLEHNGIGPKFGALWQPTHKPYRLGAAFRPPRATRGEKRGVNYFNRTPTAVYWPAELTLGGSYMLWEREYNPFVTWGLARHEASPEYQLDAPKKRRYVLLALDVVLTAPSPDNTFSMRPFLTNTELRAGEVLTASVRAGVESEVISNWLVLRGGTYYEPTRISPSVARPRLHGTTGAALRIPFWPIDLRGDFSADLARDYFQYGFGVGFWH